MGVGLLMLLWCLSGVVMMFVGYPELTEARRIQGLQRIDWSACCRLGDPFTDDQPVGSARVQAVAGTPVLRLRAPDGPDVAIDLTSGRPLAAIDAGRAQIVAAAFARGAGPPRPPVAVDRDQWTVSGEFNPDRPLWKVSFGDPARTEVYVSSTTGAVVQATTGGQRLWNMVGAVPHWLYFTELRRNGPLWSQVVIWTSVLGCFLTVTGLYVGWVAVRPGAASPWSPFRGIWLWHHLIGLVFGVLTLAWVASGLLSMNPWGVLEGGGGELAQKVRGAPPRWGEVRAAISAAAASPAAAGAASLELEPLAGQVFLVAKTPAGALVRLDAHDAPAPLGLGDLVSAAGRMAGTSPVRAEGVITAGDAYYFSHHSRVRLPAYRVVLKSGTRVYLDPATGQPLAILDGGGRGYRWLHQGLHQWDFVPGLRRGPAWAAIVLLMLAGVTAGVATGVWLSWKAVARDVRRAVRPKG